MTTTEEVHNIIENLSRQLQSAIGSQNTNEIIKLYTEDPKFFRRSEILASRRGYSTI